MKALLIISHGSRKSSANEEIRQLTEQVHQLTEQDIPLAGHAFLEVADPGIQSAIDGLTEKGATDIMVFPHFITAGTHVTKDIPQALNRARETHPNVRLTQLPHLGSLTGLPTLISRLAQNSQTDSK